MKRGQVSFRPGSEETGSVEAWRGGLKREQTAGLIVQTAQSLVAHDEQAKALTLAAAFQTKDESPAAYQPTPPYFEWKPWLKPVHVAALRLRGFIATSSTASSV